MSLANSILLTFSPRKCVMVRTSGDYGTPSCPAFQTLSMLPYWRSIIIISQHFLPSLLLLMLFLRQALFPTFCILLLLPFANLFQLYLTSPVLVINSFGVFTDSFHQVSHSIGFYRRFGVLPPFCRFFGFISRLCTGTHSWFSVVLLLGHTDGGCSVCPWSWSNVS